MTISQTERLAGLVVGTVSAVEPGEILVKLDIDAPQSVALNAGVPTAFPRINGYVLLPNEVGATVGLISRLWEANASLSPSNSDQFVRLPFARRTLAVTPVGTLHRTGEVYELERGVSSLPSIGDLAITPSATQLRAIVEGTGSNTRLTLGTAPFGNDANVMVDPDKLFGRHLAVLGNTGSGKSCTVAGLVRWSMEAATINLKRGERANARFIILDPNGEYAAAFRDEPTGVRRFVVGESATATPLTVPAWLWNGQEWAAFTDAKPGAQRPLLLRTLRALRQALGTEQAVADQLRTRVGGHITLLRQVLASFPQSLAKWQDNKAFAERLEGVEQGLRLDHDKLSSNDYSQLRTAMNHAASDIGDCVDARRWTNGSGFNNFQQADIERVIARLEGLTALLPLGASASEVSEDTPVPFDIGSLPTRLNEFAIAAGSGAVAHVEPLVNRIEVMLSDSRMRSVVSPTHELDFAEWLKGFIGEDQAENGQVSIVDLSLVPSDVVHIAVSVIARLTFEALQRYRKRTGRPLPTTIVLEEAHTFIRKDGEHGLNVPAADTCRQTFERIAREGRKFGLGLLLSSQRPSELSPTVLAQCNSFLLHRIVNDTDQALVRRLVPDALGDLLGELPTLPSQQAILLGWAASVPVLVKMRDLPKSHRPQSDDPDFWDVWTGNEERPINWDPISREWLSGTVGEPPGEQV